MVSMECVKTRRVGEAKRVLKVSELNKKQKMEEYQERIKDKWIVIRESENGDVERGMVTI